MKLFREKNGYRLWLADNRKTAGICRIDAKKIHIDDFRVNKDLNSTWNELTGDNLKVKDIK